MNRQPTSEVIWRHGCARCLKKGEANTALERLLAAALGIPRKSTSVVAGGTSRLKTVRIAGNAGELIKLVTELAKG